MAWATFAAKFLLAFAALHLALYIPPVEHGLSHAVAWVAACVLELFTEVSVAAAATPGSVILEFQDDMSGDSWTAKIESATHLRNIPLVVAAFVAGTWTPRWLAGVSVVATALLIGIDGIIVGADAWEMVEGEMNPGRSIGMEIAGLLSELHPMGGMFLAPVFVAAALATRKFGQLSASAPEQAVQSGRRRKAEPASKSQRKRRPRKKRGRSS